MKQILTLLMLALMLAACASSPPRNPESDPEAVDVDPQQEESIEQSQVAENELLDVGIILFEQGELTDEEVDEFGLTPQIRKAEARYISYHLSQTLQGVGAWGSVNVLPEASEIADVSVDGKIIQSTGEALELQIKASDSTGAVWFERHYRAEAERDDYDFAEQRQMEIYQAVYNRIAYDIHEYQKQLTSKDLIRIRDTSELKYAANLAPDIYSSYITTNEAGETTINRLPAADDPSIERVRKVREREYLLVNTINEHYGNYYDNVQEPYANWRKFYLLETLQKREVEREVTTKKTLGAGIVVLSVVMALLGQGVNPGLAAGGATVYQDGRNAEEEAVIHRAAIIELSQSLHADVEPIVVELDGETMALTGTLDEQYTQWRSFLEKIYQEEVGLPLESDQDLTDQFSDQDETQTI